MSDSRKEHWKRVYATKRPTEASWYQPVPARSLEFIRATGEPLAAPILDVGGGASTLVDHLLREGYSDVTVLDIAGEALDYARARLGDMAARVAWVEADIMRAQAVSRRPSESAAVEGALRAGHVRARGSHSQAEA